MGLVAQHKDKDIVRDTVLWSAHFLHMDNYLIIQQLVVNDLTICNTASIQIKN